MSQRIVLPAIIAISLLLIPIASACADSSIFGVRAARGGTLSGVSRGRGNLSGVNGARGNLSGAPRTSNLSGVPRFGPNTLGPRANPRSLSGVGATGRTNMSGVRGGNFFGGVRKYRF